MINDAIISDNFARLYVEAMAACYDYPHFENSPRGMKIKELVNQTMVLTNPRSNLFSSDSRSPDLRYLAGELLWYFSGDNTIEFIKSYSKFWERIQNEDHTLNSAYGYLLFNDNSDTPNNVEQYKWAYESLIRDKDSRQAVFHINQPKHMDFATKDFPCTIFGQFMIRNNKLNLHLTMRSNDFWFGLTYDLPFFCMLQQMMLIHLRPTYPALELGSYYHTSNSLHIYEKDFQAVEDFLSDTNLVMADELPHMIQTPVDVNCNQCDDIKAMFRGEAPVTDDPLMNWIWSNAQEKV